MNISRDISKGMSKSIVPQHVKDRVDRGITSLVRIQEIATLLSSPISEAERGALESEAHTLEQHLYA